MAKKPAPPTDDAAAAAAPAAPVSEAAAAPPVAAVPTPGTAASAPATPAGKKRQPGRAPRRGKKLRNHLKNQDQKLGKTGPAPLKQAVQMLKSMKRAKFDETVEIHMALGIDTTQSDQLVRGSVSLPHGIGKSVRVLMFCQGDNVARAKEAGADFAGGDDMIARVQNENFLDFDVALATQDMMGKVSRLGKVLGPRGLMPTPKAGTVVPAGGDIANAVREFKAGKVEYRADKGGNVHAGVGKMSFDEQKLADNITAFVEQIKHVKPAAVKGHYIKSVTLSATMSPGIPLQV
jgi:large subunit ribosomal protein L1